MLNFQDLPDELALRILSYSETKDLISCGRVSKKIRRISRDSILWVTVNLEKKIVTTELLEMILGKGCRTLNLCNSTVLGSLSSNAKSQLRVLNLSQIRETWFLEELLSSCRSLQHLVMDGVFLTPKMAVSICKNGKTLQILSLKSSNLDSLATSAYNDLQDIIKCCQELREVDLADGLSNDDVGFLAENLTPNVGKLNLSGGFIMALSRIMASKIGAIKSKH